MALSQTQIDEAKKEARDFLAKKSISIKSAHVCQSKCSHEALIFCNHLLKKKPEERVGHNGIQEIKKYEWFKEFCWEKLEKRQILSPFKTLIKE